MILNTFGLVITSVTQVKLSQTTVSWDKHITYSGISGIVKVNIGSFSIRILRKNSQLRSILDKKVNSFRWLK